MSRKKKWEKIQKNLAIRRAIKQGRIKDLEKVPKNAFGIADLDSLAKVAGYKKPKKISPDLGKFKL